MIWPTVREAYPDQWLIIEALAAHTEGNQRELDRISVIEIRPDATAAMQSVVQDGYRPFQAMALGAPAAQPPAVPLLQDRGLVDGQATAYMCRSFTCQAPPTEPEGLRAQLEQR